MKLSIILTVYNKEQYLERALNSLLNQQNVEEGVYEVLAVNDGSTDNSSAILEVYAHKDKRLRILRQHNQGLSMARNNGVVHSEGEYIWFVDADDTISPNSVRFICEAMCSKPDVIPIYAITDGIDKIRNKIDPNNHTGKDILLAGVWQHCGVFWIYRKDFLQKNNLHFLPGIYHEDAEFTPRMLYLAKNVKVVPEVLYTVFRDPNSITQVPRPKRAYDCLTIVNRLLVYFDNEKEVTKELRKKMNYRMAMMINDALFVISQNSKEEQRHFDEVFRSMPELMRPLRKSTSCKYCVESFLFDCFPGRYTKIYKLLKFFD